MQNGNSKNDLLNEIVNLSNADLDLMIDTSKFKNIMKDFGGTKEFTPEKMKSSNNINFNTHQVLSSNKPENSENQKQEKNEENNKQFLVLRIGMDFRLKCQGCGHEVMLPRLKAEKNIRKIFRDGENINIQK